MSKAKVKERRALKEQQKQQMKKDDQPKITFKQRHAKFFKSFWKVWFAGLIIILVLVLVQLYFKGQLSILIPKERVFFR